MSSTFSELERQHVTPLASFLQPKTSARSQRLAAIRSLARFIAEHRPKHVPWRGEIRSVHFKKTARGLVPYLDEPDIEALLSMPDRATAICQRNFALLLFLYNTGGRASQAANLTVADLDLGKAPHGTASVKLLGKGAKPSRFPTSGNLQASVLPPTDPPRLNGVGPALPSKVCVKPDVPGLTLTLNLRKPNGPYSCIIAVHYTESSWFGRLSERRCLQ